MSNMCYVQHLLNLLSLRSRRDLFHVLWNLQHLAPWIQFRLIGHQLRMHRMCRRWRRDRRSVRRTGFAPRSSSPGPTCSPARPSWCCGRSLRPWCPSWRKAGERNGERKRMESFWNCPLWQWHMRLSWLDLSPKRSCSTGVDLRCVECN